VARLPGTLAPSKRETRRDGHRDGLNSNSILAGADVEFDAATQRELQGWTQHLLRAVNDWHNLQQQREACNRARLAIARKAVLHAR
jgi:hypothetical protein